RVIVVDVDQSRLARARQHGITETVCVGGAEAAARILEHTGANGADATIEAVGNSDTVNLAIDSVRKGGRVTLVGNISPTATLPLQKVVARQILLQGSCASAGEYPRAIELVASGAIQVKPLITAVAPLTEGPAWFERLHAREPNLMKIVLTPGAVS